MNEIKTAISYNRDLLADFLVPACVYRNGLCGEFKCCGYVTTEPYRTEQDKYNENFLKPKN